MDSTQTVLLVMALIGGMLLLQLTVWLPILYWMRKRSREEAEALGRELEAKGETLVLGPEPALYRGSNAGHGKVRGNALIALTNKRLLVRRLVGEPIEVRVGEIAGVRETKWFLGGMKGGLSTRMGAALRHAGAGLLKQPEQRKLILLVTDGEPADIDERDPQHLRHDTRKAVEELAARGVFTYCLTLDPDADAYVKRIFGANNYTIVDRVERLPEQLPALFASLTS